MGPALFMDTHLSRLRTSQTGPDRTARSTTIPLLAVSRVLTHIAAAAAVPLTSVRQPRHQLGRTAARLLLDEAADDETHQHRQVIFEPELVLRQSTQAAPIPALTPPSPSANPSANPFRHRLRTRWTESVGASARICSLHPARAQ